MAIVNQPGGGAASLANGSVAIAKLADPTTGKFIGSASNAAAAIFPPGHEYDFVQRTTALTVTATSEGTAQTFITGNAVTYDGATRVKIEFWCDYAAATSGTMVPILLDSSTSLGWLAEFGTGSASQQSAPIYCVRFLTPTAASHTYSIAAWKTAGTCVLNAGLGGVGVDMPSWYRITLA